MSHPSFSLLELGVFVHKKSTSRSPGTVAELFAGVGGFRLGLEASGWKIEYSNQWEPSTVRQHSSEVYVRNFGSEGHSNENISNVARFPSTVDLLVGGFPCQDYSVAKSKSAAAGIQGKKGVLWWDIHRLTSIHRPRFIFLENVDRLLKSPSNQRGRDFAIMLSSLSQLGYSIEWRVVNAAEYGFPQRRRRVFIVAELEARTSLEDFVEGAGVLGETFASHVTSNVSTASIDPNLVNVSDLFGFGAKASVFQVAGAHVNGKFATWRTKESYDGAHRNLGDILLPLERIPESFLIDRSTLGKWNYLKGAKSEERTHSSGFNWRYSEGAMVFPDPLDRPSRTVLTGEGGTTPSRFKHVVEQDGQLRRLHPIELERLNGFPDDWTAEGVEGPMSHSKRAFFMGNALVVGLIQMVGSTLSNRLD